jgi:hypothetical protein
MIPSQIFKFCGFRIALSTVLLYTKLRERNKMPASNSLKAVVSGINHPHLGKDFQGYYLLLCL